MKIYIFITSISKHNNFDSIWSKIEVYKFISLVSFSKKIYILLSPVAKTHTEYRVYNLSLGSALAAFS